MILKTNKQEYIVKLKKKRWYHKYFLHNTQFIVLSEVKCDICMDIRGKIFMDNYIIINDGEVNI